MIQACVVLAQEEVSQFEIVINTIRLKRVDDLDSEKRTLDADAFLIFHFGADQVRVRSQDRPTLDLYKSGVLDPCLLYPSK